MGVLAISSFILIESPATESDEEFCAAIEGMILEAYGRRPEWLHFSAGKRFRREGTFFREFNCIAGSVSLVLMKPAREERGFERAIIYRADDGGVARDFEIRSCEETEFVPDELKAA